MGEVSFVIRKELDEEKIFCKPEICRVYKGEGLLDIRIRNGDKGIV